MSKFGLEEEASDGESVVEVFRGRTPKKNWTNVIDDSFEDRSQKPTKLAPTEWQVPLRLRLRSHAAKEKQALQKELESASVPAPKIVAAKGKQASRKNGTESARARAEKIVAEKVKNKKYLGCQKMMVCLQLLSAATVRRLRLNACDSPEALHEQGMKQWEAEKARNQPIFGKPKKIQSSTAVATTAINGGKMKKEIEKTIVVTVGAVANEEATKRKNAIFRWATDDDCGGEQCKFCRHVCGRSTPLQRHLSRHHAFRCETCVREFRDKTTLKKHQRDEHRIRHRCDLCQKYFLTLAGYKGHIVSRGHQAFLRIEVMTYNTIMQNLNLAGNGGVQLIETGDLKEFAKRQAAKMTATDVFDPKTKEKVQAHGSEAMNFYMEQTALYNNQYQHQQQKPMFAMASASNVSYVNDNNYGSRNNLIDNENPMLQESYLKSSKDEILENGANVAMAQVLEALSYGTQEMVDMACEIGILSQPITLDSTTPVEAEGSEQQQETKADVELERKPQAEADSESDVVPIFYENEPTVPVTTLTVEDLENLDSALDLNANDDLLAMLQEPKDEEPFRSYENAIDFDDCGYIDDDVVFVKALCGTI